jgi:hypothetical protein
MDWIIRRENIRTRLSGIECGSEVMDSASSCHNIKPTKQVRYSGVDIPPQELETDEQHTAHQCDLLGLRTLGQASAQTGNGFIVLLQSKGAAVILPMIALTGAEHFPSYSFNLLMDGSYGLHCMLNCGLWVADLQEETIP